MTAEPDAVAQASHRRRTLLYSHMTPYEAARLRLQALDTARRCHQALAVELELVDVIVFRALGFAVDVVDFPSLSDNWHWVSCTGAVVVGPATTRPGSSSLRARP